MKIRTRLSILFTVITATLLLLFASIIYVSAKENREKEFYSLLEKEALTKAKLFFNAQVETKTLQDIYKSNRQILNEVEVAIYDEKLSLLYHDAVEIDFVKETTEMLTNILQKESIQFYQDNWQVIGFTYTFKNKTYIITAAAYDQYGFNKIESLLQSISVVFVFSMLVIYLMGLYFSKKAFAPVMQMTERAKKISATNLDLRLNNKNSKDELSELANTFNEMLERLEKSFDAQKHFVSNISHELRTPLASIIAELELATSNSKTIDQYKSTIKNALGDTKKLVRLSNSLLDLAKASYDPSEISFKPVRIDELLLDAVQETQKHHINYSIDLQFQDNFLINTHQGDNPLLVNGNAYLLKVAFTNLLENACKFSADKKASISISVSNKTIQLHFTDYGIGISKNDLKHIFTPFYRGKNKTFSDGNGIGLYLTQKIIHLHHGKITVHSKKNQGSTFIVRLTTF